MTRRIRSVGWLGKDHPYKGGKTKSKDKGPKGGKSQKKEVEQEEEEVQREEEEERNAAS